MTTTPETGPARFTVSSLSRWQRPDGFPSDAYFETVAAALEAAGVTLEDWNREEDWEINYEISPDVVAAGPQRRARHGLYVSWRCNEEDEPVTGGFTGLGWYWVPYTKPDAGGDFAKELDLTYLAEPERVTSVVRTLVLGKRTTDGG